LTAGIGAWKLVQPSDLITALAWDLASALFILLRSRARRPAQAQLRANAPGRRIGEE
jgi:hypothetical protein